MNKSGPAAIAIDELLTGEHAEAFAEWVMNQPSSPVGDQIGAAAEDTRSRMQQMVNTGLYSHSGFGGFENIPDWLRLGLNSAVLSWLLGESKTCTHSPHPSRPEPLFAAAWKPGLIVCQQCMHLLQFRPGSVKDRTCDGCGHVTTGPEHGDGIYANALQFGPLMYQYGVCESCHDDLHKKENI